MTGEEEDPFVEPMVNLSPPTPTAAAAAAAEPTSDRSVMNDNDISVSGGGGIPDQHHGAVDRSAPNSLSSAHRQLTQRLNAHAMARWHMTIDTLRRRALLNTTSSHPPAGTGSSMAMTMGQQVVRGNNNNINIGIGQYNNFNNNMGPRRPPLRMMLPTRSMLPPLEPKPMPNQEYYVDDNDVNNSTSSTVGNNDDDEEDKKTNVKADLKKFECAICFGTLHYWFMILYIMMSLEIINRAAGTLNQLFSLFQNDMYLKSTWIIPLAAAHVKLDSVGSVSNVYCVRRRRRRRNIDCNNNPMSIHRIFRIQANAPTVGQSSRYNP